MSFPCGRCYAFCLECRFPEFEEEGGDGGGKSSPMIEMVITRNDTKKMTGGLLQAFHKYHAQGLVDRKLAITTL
jgi:hypothetical protein